MLASRAPKLLVVAGGGRRLAARAVATAAAATAARSGSGGHHGGKNDVLIRSLFRSMVREGRFFDKHPATKAVIPFPLPFSYQVLLGGRDRDFYGQDSSVADAIRAGFAERNHPQTELSDDLRIDLTLQLNVQLSRWHHLLEAAAVPPVEAITYEDHYAQARREDKQLDAALKLLERAQRRLAGEGQEEEQGGDSERGAVTRLYEESLVLKPTADAHTYLGFMLCYDGRFEEAMAHCEEAMKLDPEFGNAFNDYGLYLLHHREDAEGALAYFGQAKHKRRYDDVRYKPYLNAGHLLLEMGRPEEALVEYVQALHHAGPARGQEIRAVVCDMARVLTSEAHGGSSSGQDGAGAGGVE